MPDLSDLPGIGRSVGFAVALIIVAALVAFLAVRAAVGVGVAPRSRAARGRGRRGQTCRRPSSSGGSGPSARLAVRIGGALIAVIAVLMVLERVRHRHRSGRRRPRRRRASRSASARRRWCATGWRASSSCSRTSTARATWCASPASRAWSRTSACDAPPCATLDGTVHTVPNGQIIVASNLTLSRRQIAGENPSAEADSGDAAAAG